MIDGIVQIFYIITGFFSLSCLPFQKNVEKDEQMTDGTNRKKMAGQ